MQITQFFPLGGGLDLTTPAIATPPGRLIAAENYEGHPRGYARIDGFERFDGRPKPSEASYWVLNFDAGSAAISEGDTVTGATSGATGTALTDAVVESGDYGDGDAAGFLVLTNVSGTFEDDEELQVGGVTKCTASGTALENGADNDTDNDTWLRDAIEKARAAIGPVPGSGRIRGVWVYNGTAYAFRDNAGGTACVMHKATASGWQAQDLGRSLSFTAGGGYRLAFTSGGTYEPQVGDEIEGETSEASAIIVAIDLTSGTWAGGDAEGTLLLKDKAGTFEAENIKVGANANIATIAGDATTLEIEEGDTIVGATSGAEAVVERVVLSSGAWDDANAAGRLILSGQTGTFEAEALNIDGGVSEVATIAGDSSEITLPAGGRYEFVNHNFFGAANLRRMYGVNGVGPAFEWDGSVFVPILTGMTVDTPKHIAVHKNQLFLAFPGGSAQHSGVGEPYSFSPVTGAAEIGIGEEITGFSQDVAGVLVIWGRNKVAVLYGNDSSDWELKILAEDSGAIEWTAQKIGNPIYHDDQGLRNLAATQAFGDFRMGTISQLVEPLIAAKKRRGIRPIASMRVRAKDAYRLFWDDGTGISVYLGRKAPEILPFNYGKVVYTCCSSEDEDGDEILLFGSDDGYVYEADAGTSFDGEPLTAYFRAPFNHVGSPTQNKRWHKATLEIDASPSVQLGVIAEFAYGDPEQPPSVEQSFDIRGGGGFWNADNWDQFYWSSPVEGLAECPIDGFGRNISIAVISSAIYEEPHIIHGMTLHFTYRGLVR